MAALWVRRSARERPPEFPGALQPPALCQPKPRDLLSLRCPLPGGARRPGPSLENAAAAPGSLGRQVRRRLRPGRSALRDGTGCRRGRARAGWPIAARQGRTDLRPQPWQRSSKSRHVEPSDLLAADASCVGDHYESHSTRPARCAVVHAANHPLGRPRCAATGSMGVSEWTRAAGSRPGCHPRSAVPTPTRRSTVTAAGDATAADAFIAGARSVFTSTGSGHVLSAVSTLRAARIPDSSYRIVRAFAIVLSSRPIQLADDAALSDGAGPGPDPSRWRSPGQAQAATLQLQRARESREDGSAKAG